MTLSQLLLYLVKNEMKRNYEEERNLPNAFLHYLVISCCLG